MKRLKHFAAVLLIALCLPLVLSGCEKTSSQIEAESQEAIRAKTLESVRSYTEETFAATMKQTTYEEFMEYQNSGNVLLNMPFDNDWGYRWGQFTEKHGKVKDAVVDLVERTADGYTGRVILTGEDDGLMAFIVTYDKGLRPISTQIADFSDDSKETLGSKMATAGGNTVTGLLVVFVILVGLSLIISSFKFIGAAGERKPQKKDEVKSAPAPAPAAAPAAVSVPSDPMNDSELVAVIAAAIAAAEDRPAEGYVVRSIRRLHNNKWR